jgi:hypothetical protein
MKDPAVAAVVGVMLILVIVVSLLAVLNSSVIPGMKADAEVTHMRDVEEGFIRLSNDLSGVAGERDGAQGAVSIPLGGGDIPLNTLRSSATLFVRKDPRSNPGVSILVNGTEFPANLVQIGFHPTIHFWVDQGYEWSLGYVNVSKGGEETPLEYRDESQLSGHWDRFKKTLVSYDTRPGANGNLQNLTFYVTSFEPGDPSFLSGNGVGSVRYNVSDQGVRDFQPENLVFSVNQSLPPGLKSEFERYLGEIGGNYSNVKQSGGNATITFEYPVPVVSVHRRVVSISAG